MNILVVEDETLAAERLIQLIQAHAPEMKLVGQFDTVEETVSFFRSGKTVDLLFLDIQLADGKSFDIFNQVNIEVPVIFTTAYDQFALQAFKYYSVDYLLKPVQPEDLHHAINKFKQLHTARVPKLSDLEEIRKLILGGARQYRERFIIKTGNRLQYKSVNEAAWFFADGKTAYLVTKTENRKYLIDHTLEELEQLLEPSRFFRISRKHIVCVDCIAEVKGLISGKLQLKLNQPCDQELSVSRERAHEFKSWLNR